MKFKITDILLIVACVVSACTDNKEEPTTPTPTTPTPTPVVKPEVEEQVPIGFSAFVEQHATTRDVTPTPVYGTGGNDYTYDEGVSDISNLYGADKGFGVFAIYTGNSTYWSHPPESAERQIVMENQRVTTTDSGTTWTYSPLRFWPGNASNISFFAYAPYLANSEFAFPTSSDISTAAAADGGYKYLNLDGNNKLKAPAIAWNHSSQKDLVYGVANADVEDVNGVKIKSAGDDYTDMHRPSDGTLHWKLKHPFARAKFTIANLMQYEEELSVINISPGENGNDADVKNFVGITTYDNGQKPYAGHYIKFKDPNPNDNIPEYYHKYTEVARRLIITSVTFKKLYKSGNMVLMNEHAGPATSPETANTTGPIWENLTRYTGTGDDVYTLLPLNPQIGVNYGDYTSAFSGLVDRDEVPLNAALKDDNGDGTPELDETKTHYVLLMPQAYDSTNPIVVTVTYMICTHVQLEGNFSWQEDGPHYEGVYSTFVTVATGEDPHKYVYATGNFYKDGTSTSISGPLQFDIVANKTYNVFISLGKLMKVIYEITDWDDTHIITIPDFE